MRAVADDKNPDTRQTWFNIRCRRPPKNRIWELLSVTESDTEGKPLQYVKGAIGRPDKFVDPSSRPCKSDPAHAIVMSKCGTHAPKGTASNVFIHALIVDENQQITGQDRLDLFWSFRAHGNPQIQPGERCEHDSAPLSAHVCEIGPRMDFHPLM